MDATDRPDPGWTCRRISWAIGGIAGLATLLTLAGPGITVDEPLDVRPGRAYLRILQAEGLRFFRPEIVAATYVDNREHPPLGRWLLGIASTLGEPLEVLALGGPDPLGLYVISGRIAPALVFALLVGLVARESGRRYGRAAAFGSGFGLLMMPRVFSHAHLAALDLFIAAAWTIALVRVERSLATERPIRSMAGAGIFLGLAMLIKIQGWLLPPVVLARAVIGLGPKRALLPFLAWMIVGLIVFLVGWPWLWYETIDRLLAYLGTGIERTSIYVQYFGTVFRDRDVPWHFPWFYFATTVPVGLQALGVIGLYRGCRERDGVVLTYAGAIVAVLALFSTNVPVYDGERLYLLAFPIWAILIGRGFAWIWKSLPKPGRARLILLACFIAQSYGLVAFQPFGLSYYNLLVGGLPGAEALGLELEYWSESVDPSILRRLAREARAGETACLSPTLAPNQGRLSMGRDLLRRRLDLQDEEKAEESDWLVVYRREAYWKPIVRRRLDADDIIAVRTRQGVWLSALLRHHKSTTPPGQSGGR